MRLRIFALCTLIIMAITASVVRADSVFTVSSSPTLAIESGVAELAGSFTLSLAGGVTTASAVNVFLSPSVTITNSLTTGIQLTATGDLSTAQIIYLSNSPAYMTLSIPEGASNGSITVSGLRVDLSNGPVRSLQAFFTVSGNVGLTFTNNGVLLIANAYPGLVVDPASDLSFRSGPGVRIKPELTYTIREGYGQAFTSSIGRFGQNRPTEIRIVVRNLIEGVSLTFPGTVMANETRATLRTLSGNDIALSAADNDTSVVYRFTGDSSLSDSVLESFTLKIRVLSIARLERGATAIQAGLGPAASGAPLAGTETPRYRAGLVPALEATGIPYEDLYVPGAKVNPSMDTGLAFSNPLRTDIRVTFQALTPSGLPLTGPGISNSVVKRIPARGQLAVFASTLFNLPPDFDGTFSIKATAEFEGAFALFSFFSTRDFGIQGGIQAGIEQRREFILPRITTEANQSTALNLFNPNDRAVIVNLDFISRLGETLETSPVVIPVRGTFNADVRNLFSPGTLAAGGYIFGHSDMGVISSETFGQGSAMGGLSGQDPGVYYASEAYVSHFVQGGGFQSEVNVINRMDQTLEIEVKMLDDTGALLTGPDIGENPTTFRIARNGEFVARLDELFRIAGNRLITGQLEFEVKTYRGYYQLKFSMAGSLTISDVENKFLAALPLVVAPARQLFFAQVIEAPGTYTGITLANPSDRFPTAVTVSAYRPDGSLLGTKTFTLRPQERIARLVRELIPEVYNDRVGMLGVRATEYILGYTLLGSERLDYLVAGPPQRRD